MDSDEGSSESSFSPHEFREWEDSDTEYPYDKGQPEDMSGVRQQDLLGERTESINNGTVPTLLEIASERVAVCHPFETVERFHRQVQPVPLDLQLDIMKRAFPRDESFIRASAFMCWGSGSYLIFSDKFLKATDDNRLLIKDAVQIGFTLSGTIVHMPFCRKDGVKKASVSMEFDRQRIISAYCSVHGGPNLWCKHVVRLAIYRMRYPSAVEYHLPLSYTLQGLDLCQHKELIQSMLSDQPLEFLSKAQKILDRLTDGDETEGTAETVFDHTAGASVDKEAIWLVNETYIRHVISTYCGEGTLLRGGRECYLEDHKATDVLTETLKRLSEGRMVLEHDENDVEEDEWANLQKIDVYLQIVRLLLKRGEDTAVKLLELLTDAWLKRLETVVTVYKGSSSVSSKATDDMEDLTRNMELLSCTEDSCFPDRLIAYWRLAVLSPHYSNLLVSQVLGMHKRWANQLQQIVALADREASRLGSFALCYVVKQLNIIRSLMKWNGFYHIQVWASPTARSVINELTSRDREDLSDSARSYFDCSRGVSCTTSALAVVTCLAHCLNFYGHADLAVEIAVAALCWALESESDHPCVPRSVNENVKKLFHDFHDYLWGGSAALLQVGLIAPVAFLMQFLLDNSELWKATADSSLHSLGATGVPVPIPLRLIVKYAALQTDLRDLPQSFRCNQLNSLSPFTSKLSRLETLLPEQDVGALDAPKHRHQDGNLGSPVTVLRQGKRPQREWVLCSGPKRPVTTHSVISSTSNSVDAPSAFQLQGISAGDPFGTLTPDEILCKFQWLCPAGSYFRTFSCPKKELLSVTKNKLITTAIEVMRNLDIPNVMEWLLSTGLHYINKSSKETNLGCLIHLIVGVVYSLPDQLQDSKSLVSLIVDGMKQHTGVLASLITGDGCGDHYQCAEAEHASLLLLSFYLFKDNDDASMVIMQQVLDSIKSLVQLPLNESQGHVNNCVLSSRLSVHLQTVGCLIDLLLDDRHFEICCLIEQLKKLHLPAPVHARGCISTIDLEIFLPQIDRSLRLKIGMGLLLNVLSLSHLSPTIKAFSAERLMTTLFRTLPMIAGELDGGVIVELLSLVDLPSLLSPVDLLRLTLSEAFITALEAQIAASGDVPASLSAMILACARGVCSEYQCQEFLSVVRRFGTQIELLLVETASTLSERQLCRWSFCLLAQLSKFDTGTPVQQLNIAVMAYNCLFLSVKADVWVLLRLIAFKNENFPSFFHHFSSVAVEVDRAASASIPGSSVDRILDLLQNMWIDPQISFHIVAEMARIYKSEEMSIIAKFIHGNDVDGAASWPEPVDALKLLYKEIPRSTEVMDRCKRKLIAILTGNFGDSSEAYYRSPPLPEDLICLHIILQSQSESTITMGEVVKFGNTLSDEAMTTYKMNMQLSYHEWSNIFQYSDCRHYFYRSICTL